MWHVVPERELLSGLKKTTKKEQNTDVFQLALAGNFVYDGYVVKTSSGMSTITSGMKFFELLTRGEALERNTESFTAFSANGS